MLGITSVNVPGMTAGNVTASEVANGEFTVTVKDINAPSGISKILVPVWSENNGQDDLVWYEAQRQYDGSYKVSIKLKDHGYDTGNYTIHVYGRDNNGKEAMSLERGTIRKMLRMMRERGYNIKYIIIVGAGALGQAFADKVLGDRQLGYKICGYVDDYYPKSDKNGLPILGTTKEMNDILEEFRVDEVIIALPNTSFKRINDVIDKCEYQGIKTQVIPDYFNLVQGSRPAFDELDGIPLINTRYIPLDEPFNKFVKRALDILLSGTFLIVFSWLYLILAILVKLTSPGPIIYKQIRVGMNRREFYIYKFRSMRNDIPEKGDKLWTTEDDPRKTKFGSFIRKTSLDEIPQFFNVLKGDMSIIGPRPERPFYVQQFKDEVPKYMIKHHVRPGITGWAQVNGWRGDTSIVERINCDIEYIEKWSLLLDVKVFFMTFGALVKNAY